MAAQKSLSKARTLGKFEKAPDLETHIRTVDVDGVRVIELRDYIVSLKEYGRGYWVPLNPEVLEALEAALKQAEI